MAFREQLKDICAKAPGSIECTLMGFDGIAIDNWKERAPEKDFAALFVEFTSLVAAARRVAQQETLGSLEEVVITTSDGTAIFRILTEDYFVGLIIGNSGNAGKARFAVRLHAYDLARELRSMEGGAADVLDD